MKARLCVCLHVDRLALKPVCMSSSVWRTVYNRRAACSCVPLDTMLLIAQLDLWYQSVCIVVVPPDKCIAVGKNAERSI